MRKSKVWIYIGTVLLVCTILLAGRVETQGPPFLSAVIGTGEQEEALSCWYDTYTGTVYVFLPGYAQLDQVRLRMDHSGVYQIGERWLEDGMDCGGFDTDIRYRITAPEGMLYSGKHLIFAKSEGVSTLFLDVRSGNMTYLHEDKNHSESGVVRLYDQTGKLAYSGTVDTIKGRGQSSWREEKKSYNIRLSQDGDLLGMGSAKNWVLQANSKDATHLRNKIVLDFAKAAGLAYTPDSQWVDLYLNGEYAGLYLLCEKIEIHPKRVAIPEDDSFLLSTDWQWRIEADGEPYIVTNAATALEIRHSDYPQDILLQQLQSAENAILAENGVDPITGKSWQELIDADSWARKYLLEELFGNIDGVSLSQYYYKDGSRQDGKIDAGPAWDYDLTMHGAHNLYHVNKPGVYGSSWLPALLEKEEFYSEVVERYQSEFRPLLQQLVDTGIDAYARRIGAAVSMDHCRWYAGLQSDPLLKNESEEMATYLQKRMALFDQIWIGEVPHIIVDVLVKEGTNRFYIQAAGSTLSELELPEDMGWYLQDSNIRVDSTMPLYKNVAVYQDYLVSEEASQEGLQELLPENMQMQSQEESSDPENAFLLRRCFPVLIFVGMMTAVVIFDVCLRYRERKAEQTDEKEYV